MSDSLESEVPTHKHKSSSKKDANQELLTQIIKLAARNIGQNDDDSIDLDRLKEQLSKLTQKK